MGELEKQLKPLEFCLDETNEVYMLGAEVGYVMGLARGGLYKAYPLLWKKTLEENDKSSIRAVEGTDDILSKVIYFILFYYFFGRYLKLVIYN